MLSRMQSYTENSMWSVGGAAPATSPMAGSPGCGRRSGMPGARNGNTSLSSGHGEAIEALEGWLATGQVEIP